MLVDPGTTWSLANRIDAVLAALPRGIAAHASAETHACVVELRTAPHPSVAAAVAELALLRRALDEALRARPSDCAQQLPARIQRRRGLGSPSQRACGTGIS